MLQMLTLFSIFTETATAPKFVINRMLNDLVIIVGINRYTSTSCESLLSAIMVSCKISQVMSVLVSEHIFL